MAPDSEEDEWTCEDGHPKVPVREELDSPDERWSPETKPVCPQCNPGDLT